MSLAVLGLGTALPPNVVRQSDAAALARAVSERTGAPASPIATLYRESGISTRHTVLPHEVALEWLESSPGRSPPGEPAGIGPPTRERMLFYRREALPLALEASRSALDRSRLSPGAITHLVTVSCTGFAAPGVDVGLMKGLGLAPSVERTHVGFMGCHGAINGLRVAAALAAADPRARVLLAAVEVCSIHYQFAPERERAMGNALFADGAAALVGAPPEAAAPGEWRVAATGSVLFPDSEDALTWTIGDHGFEMSISRRIPGLIAAGLRPWLEAWLDRSGLGLDAIRSWAIHPGGPRILRSVEASLGLAPEETGSSREVLAACGNMSSPTVLFIIERLRSRGALRPCVALGFGPGLVAEAALLL
jgi:predicted naringenin-chalcone synthase